jgi:hypothetical protein
LITPPPVKAGRYRNRAAITTDASQRLSGFFAKTRRDQPFGGKASAQSPGVSPMKNRLT